MTTITFDIHSGDLKSAKSIINNSAESGWCVWRKENMTATFGIESKDMFCLEGTKSVLAQNGIKIFNITTENV